MRGRGAEKGSVTDKEGEEWKAVRRVMHEEEGILLREYDERKNSLRNKREGEPTV